ncbi:serine hydrolase domain-containing protein [Chloroflexota bacterium]
MSNNNDWPLPYAEPEEVGMSSERLSRIMPAMQKYIDNQMDPNFVTMVVRKGRVVYYEAQGYMDVESKKPVQKDTIYRLWSNTKPITGVATMICLEEGRLTLDDPISKYIPAFKNPVVRAVDIVRSREAGRPAVMGMIPVIPADREVTIRDCLRNTTGFATAANAPVQYLTMFPDIFKGNSWFTGPNFTTSIMGQIEAQARLPLESQPGTRFEYQVGYPVVGAILEMVIGKTLGEFYKERIFEPLGMKDSAFYLPEDKLARFPTCYRPAPDGDGWKLVVSESPEKSERVLGPQTYFEAGGGGGGVLSTVADYSRFAQMLLNGGELDGNRIIGRKTVELMSSSHTAEDLNIPLTGPGFGFGMGVGVYKGCTPPLMRTIGTYGWSGAAGTTCIIDPKEELIWLCFNQVMMHTMMPDNTYQEDFERMVYQSLV